MASPVIISATAPDAIGNHAPRPEVATIEAASTPAPSLADGQPDLRLIIEEDKASGTYVYKTLDRKTGEVVRQFPREEVLKLRDAEHYDPGAVFSSLS